MFDTKFYNEPAQDSKHKRIIKGDTNDKDRWNWLDKNDKTRITRGRGYATRQHKHMAQTGHALYTKHDSVMILPYD